MKKLLSVLLILCILSGTLCMTASADDPTVGGMGIEGLNPSSGVPSEPLAVSAMEQGFKVQINRTLLGLDISDTIKVFVAFYDVETGQFQSVKVFAANSGETEFPVVTAAGDYSMKILLTDSANVPLCSPLVLQRTQFAETVDDPAVLRQTVLAEMDEMANIKWKSNKTVTYRDNLTLGIFEVKADTTYYGMKYGHQGASLEAMKDACTLNGSTYVTEGNYASYDTETESGEYHIPETDLIMGNYFSNDCSTAVYWAWMKVSSSFTGERARRFVPTAANCQKFGIVPVGSYDLDAVAANSDYTFWNAQKNPDEPQYRTFYTNDDGTVNPEKLTALYESYAQLQIGDSLAQRNRFYKDVNGSLVLSTDGHTKMVRDLTVVRDDFGNIDPEQSKIATIECGGGGTKLHANSAWKFNNYSFRAYAGLQADGTFSLTEKSAVYVPATTKELATGHRDAAYIQLKNFTSPFSGIVSSNYRILWTCVTIDGDADKSYTGTFGRREGLETDILYEGLDDSGFTSAATIKTLTNTNWEAARLTYKSVNLQKHAAHFADLPSGEHTYSITVKLTTGESKTYTGTFTR